MEDHQYPSGRVLGVETDARIAHDVVRIGRKKVPNQVEIWWHGLG